MYHHSGEYVTDFCIVRKDSRYHLFHIRGERWTWPLGYQEIDLGHAVSDDLRLWQPQDPILSPGPDGAWDAAGIWAPDIIERDGIYYMFYTGADANVNQKIGLATSTDLYHWEKHLQNPVVVPGPWSDRERGKQVAGRDAMVFVDTERKDGRARYLLYYTATTADGRPCIALAESTDLFTWQDLGPTYIEDNPAYNRCESAYVVKHSGHYYLFYSAKGGPQSKGNSPADFDHFDIVYLVSADPIQGWQKPANHELLTEWTCASEHPTFDGTTFMFYVIQEEIEGIWGASVLSDPKTIGWRADGTVQVKEYLPENVGKRVLFADTRDTYAGWMCRGGNWTVKADRGVELVPAMGESDGETYLVNPLWGRDVAIEADIRAEANGIGSLLVRANPSGTSGYRIALDFATGTVGLYRMLYQHPDHLIQSRTAPVTPEQWHKLKVVIQGQFFDIYVDDALQIVRENHIFPEGCFGLHAVGTVNFRAVSVYEYIGPEKLVGDAWNHQARPRHLFPTHR